MNGQPSLKGQGVNIFFPTGQNTKKSVTPARARDRNTVTKDRTSGNRLKKITFRIPGNLAEEFDNLFIDIKKNHFSVSKNDLGTGAIRRFIKQYRKGDVSVVSL